MNKGIKLKGKMRALVQSGIILGVLLALCDILVYFTNVAAGLIVSAFLVIYFGVVITLYSRIKKTVINEMISFATEYGQIQRKLLRNLELPYALLDENGKVIWTNNAFEEVINLPKGFNKSITSVFPNIILSKLPSDEVSDEASFNVGVNDKEFTAKIKKISLNDMVNNSELMDAPEYDGYLFAFYLFDETALRLAIKEVDEQSLAVGMIYLDNYEEALESVDEVKRSLMLALIDRKINKYVASFDGISKKLEKDKYLVILKKAAVVTMKENRFEILEEVKTVNISNEMSVTISIGIGMDGLSYAQNYEFARNAIDLALGRGGDQAVLKTPSSITYYGGKSQQVEKNTRVKARVKAHALCEIISAKDEVLIMGHKIPDVDSFGSAVGVAVLAASLEKKAHIVLSEVPSALEPLVNLFKNNTNYGEDFIISSQQAIDMAYGSTALIIVDVNKPDITECPELISLCKSVVVIDHHRQSTETIENATLSYIEPYASSASEMVSEILQYSYDSIRLKQEEADVLYSGIMIDTNNFLSKTGVRTFEAAAYLRRNGADVTRVRKLFREDAQAYKAKADTVSQAEIYKDAFAISVCDAENLSSPTVVGAQAANELLNIKGVKASFVVTDYRQRIYISARSIDEVNVQIIMEKMGGGGHLNIAAAQLDNTDTEQAISLLKETIDTMLENKEI